MARDTTRLAVEESSAARSGTTVETACGRLWSFDMELIVEQRPELWRDQIRRLVNGESDARIAEVPVPAHLRDAHIAVPVRDGTVAGVGLEADALEPIGGRGGERGSSGVKT